jgi:hypothetical protein
MPALETETALKVNVAIRSHFLRSRVRAARRVKLETQLRRDAGRLERHHEGYLAGSRADA